VKRTQIYLDEQQDELLAERAAAVGTTKSDLIRMAIDQYLGRAGMSLDDWRSRWQSAVRDTAGTAPYLPSSDEWTAAEARRTEDRARLLESHWRR
jgi:hypothetical protein